MRVVFPPLRQLVACLALPVVFTACQTFKPYPEELDAGRLLASKRSLADFPSLEEGRALAEKRRHVSPIGSVSQTIEAIRPQDSFALKDDLTGAVKQLKLTQSLIRFFFIESKPGGRRLTEVERNGNGWRIRTAETGAIADLPSAAWSTRIVPLDQLGLNFAVKAGDVEPRVEPHDRILVEYVPVPSDEGVRTTGTRLLEFGVGATSLFIPGTGTSPARVLSIESGQSLTGTMAELEKKKKEFDIDRVLRAQWSSGARSIFVDTGSGERETPYTLGMSLGDAVQQAGKLPPRRTFNYLRLVLLRPHRGSQSVLFGVQSDGESWFGRGRKSSVILFPGDSLTILPELIPLDKGAIVGSSMHRTLVAHGLVQERPGDRIANLMVYVSKGSGRPDPVPWFEEMTLADVLRSSLQVTPPAEKEMYRAVWLQPAEGKKPAVLVAASITKGCWFGRHAPPRDLPLLPGDRIQIMPGRYDPDKDRRALSSTANAANP